MICRQKFNYWMEQNVTIVFLRNWNVIYILYIYFFKVMFIHRGDYWSQFWLLRYYCYWWKDYCDTIAIAGNYCNTIAIVIARLWRVRVFDYYAKFKVKICCKYILTCLGKWLTSIDLNKIESKYYCSFICKYCCH